MLKSKLIAGFMCLSLVVFGQKEKTKQAKVPLVHVINWTDWGLLFTGGYFDSVRDTLIAQIGKDEFEKVKLYSTILKWPRPMHHKPDFKKDSIAKKAFYEKLERLKMYKIASYNWIKPDGSLDSNRSVLRIPYTENKNWDTNAQWDTVYFIITSSSLKEVH